MTRREILCLRDNGGRLYPKEAYCRADGGD
jgi:hypothetical protein